VSAGRLKGVSDDQGALVQAAGSKRALFRALPFGFCLREVGGEGKEQGAHCSRERTVEKAVNVLAFPGISWNVDLLG
jgi:hypothetical protein